MIKLTGSVGRMGLNKKHDVALVQRIMAAIKVQTKLGRRPIWTKKPDGRYTREMEPAIMCLQKHMGMKPTGKLECTIQTMNALTKVAPRQLRSAASVASTSAAVRGPSDPARESFRIAAETVAKAPFPLSERKTLARAYRSLGPGHNICLSRKKDWVTGDGRFATELEIDGDLSGTLAERNQVHQIICRFITSQGVWEKGNPNDLKFRSKRQLKALKGLGTGPLSADDKKLLGLTTPPREAVLVACAKGCARLISSGNIAKPEGEKEAQIIIEAAGNADAQLGQLLVSAVSAGTSKTPPPTRAAARSAPFMDPVVQRVAEVMFDALSGINPKSVAENREYYLEIFLLISPAPGAPLADTIRNIRATLPKSGDRATIPPASRARITNLTDGREVLAWGHTHGGPDPQFDNENFSSGDLLHSKVQQQHGGLGTPAGRFLFFNIDDGVEYDLTPMFGSLPT